MSRFKLSNLTPKRAAQIRRGVVSGKILLNTLTAPHSAFSESSAPVWVALKLHTYVCATESYLEQEALMHTVVEGVRKIFSDSQMQSLSLYYANMIWR